MDGPGDYHTKWSKSEKDEYHMLSLLCRIFKNDTNELIYKTETLTDLENEFMVTRGKGGWERYTGSLGLMLYLK